MAIWTDPPDRDTGDLITESEWEALLGPNGSMAYLGENLLVISTPTGDRDGVNKEFTLASTPVTEVLLIVGGVMLIEADGTYGFTRVGLVCTLGTSVPAPTATENIRAIYGA